MKLHLTAPLKKKLAEIKKRDRKLIKKVHKQLRTFESNPRHPSLRTHKLSGNLENMRSISIDKGLRMTYRIEKETDENAAVFFDIGTHDEVYKK